MKINIRLFFALLLSLCSLPAASRADEIPLWNQALPLGQWRAFGAGMLQASAAGAGLALEVDWTSTTFGVGVVFEGGEDQSAFPSLKPVHSFTVEAKTSVDDGTVLAPEWVVPSPGHDVRVAPADQVALTSEWQTFTFRLPDDFPGLASEADQVTALRLLFLNKDKTGRARILFRNVQLVP